MALGLVARSARAISDHLNLYYRVFKGIDPDSVILRLPGGGAFEVRHSVTATPLLRVTDTGATMTGVWSLPGNTVTSEMILDGTIRGQDIATNTITSDKLVTGAPITPNSITAAELAADSVGTSELQDNAVATANIAANAVTQSGYAYASTLAQEGTPGTWFDMPGMSVSLTTTGGPILLYGTFAVGNTAASQAVLISSNVDSGAEQNAFEVLTSATGNTRTTIAYLLRLGSVTAGAHTFKMRWRSGGGTMNVWERAMLVTEHKR